MYRGSVLVPHPLLEESEEIFGRRQIPPRLFRNFTKDIVGDPGAVSRVDKTSVVKVYCKMANQKRALQTFLELVR